MAANEMHDHQTIWAERFGGLSAIVRDVVGDDALRIDHIGSTSVPGLASKDVVDMQVTVATLAVADAWPDRIGAFERRVGYIADHVPPGGPPDDSEPDGSEWAKRFWSQSAPYRAHLHVRALGRANQRYALLFRDFLRTHPNSAVAYERVKRQLAALYPDDGETYSRLKDPVCDIIVESAELWVAQTGWEPGPSDG